jgi:hypothetical protein
MPSPTWVSERPSSQSEQQFAGGAADRGIREIETSAAIAPGANPLPRVSEDEDVAAGRQDAGVQRDRLAAGRHLDQADGRAERGECRAGVVGGSVGHDDDLAWTGIGLGEQIGHRARQAGRFVPGGDHHRDRRPAASLERRRPRPPAAVRDPAPRPRQDRDTDVDVSDDQRREPEEERHGRS